MDQNDPRHIAATECMRYFDVEWLRISYPLYMVGAREIMGVVHSVF